MIERSFAMGGYLPLESVVHRLDPRTKLVGLVVLLGTVFMSRSLIGIGVCALVVAGLVALTRAGWKIWGAALARFTWMLLIVLAANLLFYQEGRPVFAWGMELPMTWEGLERGIAIAVQLGLAIVLSLILTLTTSPSQLTRAGETLSRPLERVRVPVRESAVIVMLAIRFLPLLHHELRTIVDAQKSRGVEFETGSPAFRARNFVSVLVPALSGALRRADTLSVAMGVRGFRPGKARSAYRSLRFSQLDHIAWVCLGSFLFGRIMLLG